jgi:hypothetical protein
MLMDLCKVLEETAVEARMAKDLGNELRITFSDST